MFLSVYDVIVVGGGHAGVEAASAAGNLGASTLLITMNLQTIAQMSCNPAMGGIAKGQIIREIDALGGHSGIVTDKTMIQFKMLNLSKGAAMWSPRAQSDRMMFAEEWRSTLEKIPNVDFFQDMVSGLLMEKGKLVGVKTRLGQKIRGKSVILTNGTFLNGLIHIGEKQFGGGRMAEVAATGITEELHDLGFQSGRMKTGTPPRVDGRSLDYSKMIEQPGDEIPGKFSFLSSPKLKKQRSCYLTYTSPLVHEILKEGFEKSPMFNGRIKGIGPRYCPSIEDKINRFADKDRHQIFVEPEGWTTCETYINGFSTSLPETVQAKALRQIAGFKNAKIYRPGYAIEYDYFPPTQLKHTLETKNIANLYFAGQINGTTGYEEAAAQGLMAGINAHLKLQEKEPFVLARNEAYIGVLIDDLVIKGTDEPYRMFTSRAEYRILLRQDNADERLTELGYKIGLAKEDRWKKTQEKYQKAAKFNTFIRKTSIKPEQINQQLEAKNSALLKQSVKMNTVLSRPHVYLSDFTHLEEIKGYIDKHNLDQETTEQAEIQIKYSGYIQREKLNAEKLTRLEKIKLPTDFDYHSLASLSSEAKEKLSKLKPNSIAQAARVSGISPADINVLLIYIGR